MVKMEKRNSFVFYDSFYSAISKITDNDLRAQAYDMVFNYAFNKVEPTTDEIVINLLFELIKPLIDSAKKRYEASVENGKKGGAPKGNKNALKSTTYKSKVSCKKISAKNKIDTKKSTQKNTVVENCELYTSENTTKNTNTLNEENCEIEADFVENKPKNFNNTNNYLVYTTNKKIKNKSSCIKQKSYKIIVNKSPPNVDNKVKNFSENACTNYDDKQQNDSTNFNQNTSKNGYKNLSQAQNIKNQKYSKWQNDNVLILCNEDYESFKSMYPKKNIKQNQVLPQNFCMDKLLQAIENSAFLKMNDNLNFSWLCERYNEIIDGKYKNFVKKTYNPSAIITHQYSEEELNSMFTDLDSLDI